MMPRASWNEGTIAEAETGEIELVEGNVYFPPERVRAETLLPSEKRTVCPWKGTASYYHLTVGGEVNRDAAWYYPDPHPAAENIRGYIAFWRGVKVER